MRDLIDRFLDYVKVETTSDEGSDTFPSTPGQRVLGQKLVDELHGLGISDAAMDANGYVFATLSGNLDDNSAAPVVGFLAHMDTSDGASGKDVKPIVHRDYQGGDIVLPGDQSVVITEADNPDLANYVGQDIITADGTTLLGADDKAGVAEIMTAVEYLLAHPEIKHGDIRIGFTPDEEIGQGTDHFDVAAFGADVAYTIDGGRLGELENENFNAATAVYTINGVNVHPGDAYGKMKNAALITGELTQMLPADETPATTRDREGFFHLYEMKADESEGTLKYLVRDHDAARFEERKDQLQLYADFLNVVHGTGTVELTITDSYKNMKEVLDQHPEATENAAVAYRRAGVEPEIVPIRGGTDGARLSFMGLPCPNVFTGGHNYHGKLEYIPVQSMEKAVDVIVNIAEVYAEGV